ncbi:glycosyltransferase [Leuconostoc gasicomitatum]|uniref:glycosyltransferase n=2 Tax=Leuconostoc gasicomitatum TaxID=115778 RepID=UPI001CC80757|nr:glycosyltransferase [Leuconostoc gasicomitatum]MBZ5959918.1 glycosyltransferase [Leuconostoc gasicomitatum]MBZ5969479.1 glycosyltransferase [Leuconostoc gasicomitatum]MBZ5984680.1 glycosyltransferase [Leuconostoc gasicomitatum]MBZ5994859.1 glycosyltransferase [Leuconostoc gasicomitatum]MBZ5998714.1 glycosyltransferase [Leuconostoc gasicomitatum]
MAKSDGKITMTIEIINSLTYTDSPGVAWQIERVKSGKSSALWLATPHEDAAYLLVKMGLNPALVYDMYAQRYVENINSEDGIWWTDLPVPNNAQLILNKDRTKSIMSFGHEIARVRWFNDSQRIIQAVVWYDLDGKIDYKDIYRRDGKLFAKQYFSEGNLLESDFYVGQKVVQIRDFYFENHRNFVYAYDQKYPQAEDYIASVGNKWPSETFNITQLGREIHFAPKNTTLTIIGGVLDEKGQVWHNLALVLREEAHKIKQVIVTQRDFDVLKSLGFATHKLRVGRI